MAYSVVSNKSGKNYFLHLREQKRKDGGITKLYYFAGQPGESVVEALPEGYMVIENEKTGLPFLKKKA